MEKILITMALIAIPCFIFLDVITFIVAFRAYPKDTFLSFSLLCLGIFLIIPTSEPIIFIFKTYQQKH